MPSWLSNWLERHQHPVSRVLHGIGIPLLPACGWLVVVQLIHSQWPLWWRPLALLLLSYVLQWIGHRIEGNDMGEMILVKKLLGKSYIAVSPKYGGGVVDVVTNSNAPVTPAHGGEDATSS